MLIACRICILYWLRGREANPIPSYLPGDENRSCPSLKAEMAQIQAEMEKLLPSTNKFATNTLWAVGGCLLIVPFFFMDLKDAEKIEYNALKTRYNRLLIIASEKSCDLSGVSTQALPFLMNRRQSQRRLSKKCRKYLPKTKKVGS